MIEQTVNPEASIAGLKGLGAKGGKSAKAGLFAKLMAAFQTQLKQSGKASAQSAQLAGNSRQVGHGIESLLGDKSTSLHHSKGKSSSALMIHAKWNQAEVSEEDAILTAMESLMAGSSEKGKKSIEHGKSADELKAALLSEIKGHGAEEGVEAAGDTQVQAGLAEAALQQRFEKATSTLEQQSQSQEKSKGAQGREMAHKGDQAQTVAHNVDAKGLGSEKVVATARSNIGEMGADDWIAANSGNKRTQVIAASVTKPAAESDVGIVAANEKRAMPLDQVLKGMAAKSGAGAEVADGQVKDHAAKQGAAVKVSDLSMSNPNAQAAMSDDIDRVAMLEQQSTKAQIQSRTAEAMVRSHHDAALAADDKAEPVAATVVPNKARAASLLQQALVGQGQAGVSEKGGVQVGEFGAGTSQQDMNSNAQTSETLLADSAKADAKASRGADFAAHMNYKTAHVYKPAEAMIEIARSAKDGSMKLDMQLEPAHLGKVQVTLQSDAGKQLQVHITVDQALSRQVIEQHLPQLRTALAQQGLDLGQFSMDLSSQGGDGGAAQPEGGAFNEFAMHEHSIGEVQESVTRIGVNRADDGHISILA